MVVRKRGTLLDSRLIRRKTKLFYASDTKALSQCRMHNTQIASLSLPSKLWISEDEHAKSASQDLKCSFFSLVNEILRQEVLLSL